MSLYFDPFSLSLPVKDFSVLILEVILLIKVLKSAEYSSSFSTTISLTFSYVGRFSLYCSKSKFECASLINPQYLKMMRNQSYQILP